MTLQSLDLVTDHDLGWRPGSDYYTLGQQFLHIAQYKAQIAVYLRQMGKPPPYFAAALEGGSRPDVGMREKFGGF